MTLIHIVLSVLGTISWATEVVTTAPPVDIYWNRTNDIFLQSNNDHIIQVQIKERIRFLCPYYDSNAVDQLEMEHYIIYRLPKQYFDSCYLPPNADEGELRTEFGIEKVHNCSSPYDPLVFISYIDTFVPLPGRYGGLAYETGQEYYFTTISTGSVSGLHNRLSDPSACKRFNMKAIVRVCCNENATHTCPTEAIKCGEDSAFTNPPLVTVDPNAPDVPPTTTRHTTPTTQPSRPSVQPTVSWTTIRSPIINKGDNTTPDKFTDSEPHINKSPSVTWISTVIVLVACLILGRVTLGLT